MSLTPIELVSKMLRDEEMEIEDAIESGELPDKLLHQLATDCIDRALQRLTEIGKKPEDQSWNALKAKRDWLIEKCDDEGIKAAQEEVMTTEATTAWGVVRSNAPNAARNCVRSLVATATEAEPWSKRTEANYKERGWIIKRLNFLCEVWTTCGERAPFLLQGDEECPVTCPEEATISFELT